MFPHQPLIEQVEKVIPPKRVFDCLNSFLARCGWELEIDEMIVAIPPDSNFKLRSRAFVKADSDDVFCDDHFEAIVAVGSPAICILKLYFNLEGAFVSEDRFNAWS